MLLLGTVVPSKTPSPVQVRRDFDRIAMLQRDRRDHLGAAERWLLAAVPGRCSAALDVGCGSGSLTRAIAQRANTVAAIDLSPNMIAVAKRRSASYRNIEYHAANFMTWPYNDASYDCIVCVAMLHHVDFARAISKMVALLRPGGTLLIQDLVDGWALRELPFSVVAAAARRCERLFQPRRTPAWRELARAWAEHGERESYLSLAQVRRLSAGLVPGATVHRHLTWRYSIVWGKPPSAP